MTSINYKNSLNNYVGRVLTAGHNRCLAIWRKRTYRLPPHRQAPKRQAVKKPHIAYNSSFKIASSPNFKHHIRLSF
jgi:hypothetical protein